MRWREQRLFLAVVIGLPLCESIPLHYFHVTAGLAPQVTALTPFAVFHDLRWVLVFHRSWPGFAMEIVALLFARSLFHAFAVRSAWPTESRPTFMVLWRRAALFTAIAVIVLMPPAMLAFAAGVTSLSWLVLAELPLLLCVVLLICHGGVGERWWASLPGREAIEWALFSFVVLHLAAAAVLLSPWWLAWLSAALAGLFNAWSWNGLVGSLATNPPAPRPIPVVAFAFLGLFATAIFVTAWQVHVVGGHAPAAETPSAATRIAHRVPVLVVSGFDSNWSGRPDRLTKDPRFLVRRFSYAGSNARGTPLPYHSTDTHVSVGQLETKMNRQVRALAATTHQPVALLAVSEGAVVARSYLQEFPSAPVTELVMLSPLVEPGRVYYPRPGAVGWGVVSRAEMELLNSAIRGIVGTDLDPDMPFLRSIVDAPALRTGMLCPAPRTPVVAFLPIASAASIPPSGSGARIPVRIIGGFHGAGIADALRYIATDRLPKTMTGAGVLNRVLRASATAWMVPELPPELNPAWNTPTLAPDGCPENGWPAPQH